ncbi:MAG: hypothetical protein LBS01_05245 [Prevotellaceae bacterium]|jgi:hypothetical protein|nr:hypothetical protein [Prevotellaceae bacterium]
MKAKGITIERDSKGVPAFVRIDLRRYGEELKDFFINKEISLSDKTKNPALTGIAPRGCITLDEFAEQVKENVHLFCMENDIH